MNTLNGEESRDEIAKKNTLRKKINRYSYRKGLFSFGYIEYVKSFFHYFFKIDSVSSYFFLTRIFSNEDTKNISNQTIEGCILNLHRLSKRFLGAYISSSSEKERLINDYRADAESRFAYDFLRETELRLYFDDILKYISFAKSSGRPRDIDRNVFSPSMVNMVKLVYKIILMYDQNKEKTLDRIIKTIRRINKKYIKKEMDSEFEMWLIVYRQAFLTLMSYKKEFYPFILKYIEEYYDEYDNENNYIEEKDNKIYKFVGINPEELEKVLFNYQIFEKKELERELRMGEVSAPKGSMDDLIKQALEILQMRYPSSSIENIKNFEFILPYFYKFLILKEGGFRIEKEEFAFISKEDPVQIVVCLHSIIWYNFLNLFDFENGADNDLHARLSVIKTKWISCFQVFQKYFKNLLEYNREFDSKREVYEKILNDTRREIFNIDKLYKGESLSYLLTDLCIFLNEIKTKGIDFLIWSKDRQGEKIGQEEKIAVFSSYRIIIDVFKYLLVDRNSFLILKTSKTHKPTEVEKDILNRFSI